jgi:hypothetical protein
MLYIFFSKFFGLTPPKGIPAGLSPSLRTAGGGFEKRGDS